MIVPTIIAAAAIYALAHKVDVYSALVTGAGEGLQIMLRIVPALIGLLTAIYMLRASGALDYATAFLSPVLTYFGIPPECAPLMLLRPFSGAGALALGSELIMHHGPDSDVGRTVAVMLGSTETTFYTISVYFGSIGISKTRYAIPAALLADVVGFIAASLAVKVFF